MAARRGTVLRRVGAEQQRDLRGVEEAAAAAHGSEQVLGPDDRVVLAEPRHLGFDVPTVGRVDQRDVLPVHLEVPAGAVTGLGLTVQRDLASEERVVGPDSPSLYSTMVTCSPRRLCTVWLDC
jgi:hypothetical protein